MFEIDPNILVALIAGTITVLGYFITRYLEKKKLVEIQIREQKLPVYEEFVDFLFKIFKETKEGKTFSEKEIKEIGDFYWVMNKKAVLWLSDKTLKSYSNWKSLTSDYADKKEKTTTENVKIMYALEALLLDFRSDIGHSNKKIDKGDILMIFINNFKNMQKENKHQKNGNT